jgi:hypothetical protein
MIEDEDRYSRYTILEEFKVHTTKDIKGFIVP